MSRYQYSIFSRWRIIAMFCALLSISTIPVMASEVWINYEKMATSDFIQKIDEDFYLLHFPERSGVMSGYSRQSYYARDGFLGMGIQLQNFNTIQYNLEAAQFFYHLLRKEDLTKPAENIDLFYSSSKRTDFMVDLYVNRGPWELRVGGKMISGDELFQLSLEDGMASNSIKTLYSFQSNYSMWKGYAEDTGSGMGYTASISYQPTEHWKFTLSGDDLAAYMEWQGLDLYEGRINLDFIDTDENGYTFVQAPMQGIFHPESILRQNYPALLKGQVEYVRNKWKVVNWLQYREGLGLGSVVTLTPTSRPELTFGLLHQNHHWLGNIGIGWPNLRVQLAINALDRMNLTEYRLLVETHLF